MVTKTHYDALGISTDATEEEIKQAFRKLAKIYHPDVSALDSGLAGEIFKEISNAYEILSNPAKKSFYDHSMKYGGFSAQTKPMYKWVYLMYLDDYGWSPRYKREWNEHHDVMYG